jgi:hypothetical protein
MMAVIERRWMRSQNDVRYGANLTSAASAFLSSHPRQHSALTIRLYTYKAGQTILFDSSRCSISSLT